MRPWLLSFKFDWSKLESSTCCSLGCKERKHELMLGLTCSPIYYQHDPANQFVLLLFFSGWQFFFFLVKYLGNLLSNLLFEFTYHVESWCLLLTVYCYFSLGIVLLKEALKMTIISQAVHVPNTLACLYICHRVSFFYVYIIIITWQ